ncbi:MAG: enoyl-CoA hydratase/isomerase family protein [Synergistaceae bacterium]|nr:enoyl-CoA hydratase/isomerase family protein [Synergistaceae bacterium]
MGTAVKVEFEGRVAWLTLDCPENYNSLTPEMCDALNKAILECENDENVRAVVLAGSGKAFCSGGDLRTIEKLDDYEKARSYVHRAGQIVSSIVRSAKPYIAMVNGAAAGAGFNIAIACDFVCASPKARFTQAFSSVGLISDCGGNFLLPRLVGQSVAKELMLLPKALDAGEALTLGIVGSIVEEDKLRERVAKLAGDLAKRSPLAVKFCKRMFLGDSVSFTQVILAEEDIQARLITGEDCKEGIRAFFEKRPPAFRGRS